MRLLGKAAASVLWRNPTAGVTPCCARDTSGQVVVLIPSVGGEKEITDYFKLFDYDIAKLKQALDATR